MSKEHTVFMLQDEELIKGCAKGDRASQKALYERYCRKMMVTCQRYARDEAEAEDTLQEGFVKVFKHLPNFRFESKLSTWMTRIMINTALNKQRQRLNMLPMVDVEEVQIKMDEELSLTQFHLNELLSIVRTLPDGCRIVFNLFAIEGYSHKEIGEMLSISVGTSKSQYNRARSLLQERIGMLEKTRSYGNAKV
ncbi:MAG: sigma-70 family RNA polymerase sigma factor [Cyclobacteriaceae bacterium]